MKVMAIEWLVEMQDGAIDEFFRTIGNLRLVRQGFHRGIETLANRKHHNPKIVDKGESLDQWGYAKKEEA